VLGCLHPDDTDIPEKRVPFQQIDLFAPETSDQGLYDERCAIL
jgi:hypothetical protein